VEVTSPGDAPDTVVALNAKAVENQVGALAADGLLVCPEGTDETKVGSMVQVRVDFDTVATSESGSNRNRNLVAAGALMQILGLDLQIAETVVRDSFAKKSQAVIEAAERALRAGYALLVAKEARLAGFRLKPSSAPPRLLMAGNEAVALGAIAAGVRFYAGYPITPASEIMEVLAKHLPEVGGRALQAEDEIASIGMCIGAAFGGAKTLTATSGPGLSLKTELLGLASMAELPIVVVNVQRSGPSTGMPTKDGQGDLNIAVYGAHGDSPRVVLAPQSVSDCFDDTVRAVNLAHQFHLPVLVLSSQSLSHRMQTVKLPSLDEIEVYEEPLYSSAGDQPVQFRRYQATEDGRASIRSIPGIASGMYRTGGLEHDETGQPCFDASQRNANQKRRRDRLAAVARHLTTGEHAEKCTLGAHSSALVSWGTTAGPAKEAIALVRARHGWDIGTCFPRLMWPLPAAPLKQLIASGIDTLYVVEANDSQQFAQIIRANLANELHQSGVKVIGITRDDGSPFTANDIAARLEHALSSRNDNSLPTG
jgi:2-oxoglutarate ferredoxin oxidoreductase subunit alpha